MYQPATAYSNCCLGSLASNTESRLEPLTLPQAEAVAKQDSQPQVEAVAKQDSRPQAQTAAEYSQLEEDSQIEQESQEPDSLIKEIAGLAREETEPLETDHEYDDEDEDEDMDEYGMTDKAEKEFCEFVVEIEAEGSSTLMS